MVTKIFAVFIVVLVSGCTYDAAFKDCEISCTDTTGCPNSFSCSMTEGLCRADGVVSSCTTILGDAGLDGVDGADGADAVAAIQFAPSNLGSSADDLHAGTQDVILSNATINTDTGTITGLTLGVNDTRIQTQTSPAPEIEVFRFKSLRIQGAVTVVGTRALAIVTVNSIVMSGSIQFTGQTSCVFGTSGNGAAGGGGAGFGGMGANGGLGDMSSITGVGGAVRGTASLTPLVPGCKGARGSTNAAVVDNGGLGGGAIQLVAGGQIDVSGTICLPGGGGGIGAGNRGGGGGGAGGALLLEAPTVYVQPAATITAHGGGGGGSGGLGATAGGTSCSVSSAGVGGIDGATPAVKNAGDGGYGTVSAQPGTTSYIGTGAYGGGGGGGVGRVRINRADNGTPSGAVSPAPSLGTLLPL